MRERHVNVTSTLYALCPPRHLRLAGTPHPTVVFVLNAMLSSTQTTPSLLRDGRGNSRDNWLRRLTHASAICFTAAAALVATWLLIGGISAVTHENGRRLVGAAMRGIAIAGAATAIAFPLSIVAATYMAIYASSPVRKALVLSIDIGASVPGVIWAWLVLYELQALQLLELPHAHPTKVAIGMVSVTLIANCTRRVYSALRDIPPHLLENAIALGASRWDALRIVGFRSSAGWLGRAALRCLTRGTAESITLMLLAHVYTGAAPTLSAYIASSGLLLHQPNRLRELMPSALLLTLICYALRRLERDPRHAEHRETP
jgi:ABC-type phosphate transport system permease subunit